MPDLDANTAPAPAGPRAFPTECDLIMKGGITSGVVYPLAIVAISTAFRLRNIGGTSAGAIAAAAAAAAELGRQRRQARLLDPNHEDFQALGRLPDHLGTTSAGGRGTKLLAFFRPSAALAPVFNVLTAALSVDGTARRLRLVIGGLLRRFPLTALLGFVLGSLPLWFMPLWSVTIGLALWLLAFGGIAAITLVVVRIALRLAWHLPRNRFGFCSGMPSPGDRTPDEALTVWMTTYYNDLSGQSIAQSGAASVEARSKPLTFGDLKQAGIHLEVMTTCLTLGRPYRLPFRDDPHVRENRSFLYKEAEFRELFPKEVVDWMVQNERSYAEATPGSPFKGALFDGFRCLPDPDNLPVVMAVRMSLSFPILLSAIPLYAFDFRNAPFAGKAPERCWFTDGGVGSNFPIHFFDTPIPTRPTFGLDLGETTEADDGARVKFPQDNGDARLPYWKRFDGTGGLSAILGFLGTVVSVAKDWNHETLSHLPGFRDRIGLIRLTPKEGGLNLTMDEARIRQLTEFGRQAGVEFVRRFGNPPPSFGVGPADTMNWDNHQLIRLRLLLASVAELLAGVKQAAATAALEPLTRYDRFFSSGDHGAAGYRFKGRGHDVDQAGAHLSQAGLAKALFDGLLTLADLVDQASLARGPLPDGDVTATGVHPAQGAPKPTPELKLRPRI